MHADSITKRLRARGAVFAAAGDYSATAATLLLAEEIEASAELLEDAAPTPAGLRARSRALRAEALLATDSASKRDFAQRSREMLAEAEALVVAAEDDLLLVTTLEAFDGRR